MQLYDDVTAVAERPAAPPAGGTPGYFTDGVPGSKPRSVVRAWMLNLLMAEILAPITEAGLTPSRTDGTQLLQAIRKLIAESSIPFASDAETLAGALANKAVTPKGLKARVDALVDGAPGTLATLKKLAAALGDDPAFAATMASALAGKAPLWSPALSGAPTGPTPDAGDISTRLATTAFIDARWGGIERYVYTGTAYLPATGQVTSRIDVLLPRPFPTAIDMITLTAVGQVNSSAGAFPVLASGNEALSGFRINADTNTGSLASISQITFNQAVPVRWRASGH